MRSPTSAAVEGSRYPAWLLMCAGLLALAACGDSESSGIEAQEWEIPRDWLEETLEEASDWQRAILEDGLISFADYERAVFATVACLEERGVTIASGPELDDRNVYQFVYSGDDPEEINTAYWECYEEHQDIIDRVWAATGQINPTEAELAAAREALAECLRDEGIEDLPDPASSADLNRILQAEPELFRPCSERISEEFGIPGFVG